jgi:hypothetical protein
MSESTLKRTERIAELLAAVRPKARSRPPLRRDIALARALFWEPEQLEVRDINLNSVRSVVRVNVGGQGVAVFAFETDVGTKQLVESVAFYAYHASIEWGIVGNKEHLTIFNSHRVRRGSWFELPANQDLAGLWVNLCWSSAGHLMSGAAWVSASGTGERCSPLPSRPCGRCFRSLRGFWDRP